MMAYPLHHSTDKYGVTERLMNKQMNSLLNVRDLYVRK